MHIKNKGIIFAKQIKIMNTITLINYLSANIFLFGLLVLLCNLIDSVIKRIKGSGLGYLLLLMYIVSMIVSFILVTLFYVPNK